MSDAPERVWVETNEYDSDMGPYFAAYIYEWEGVEYIRADIHRREMVAFDQLEAEVARLREALKGIQRDAEDAWDSGPDGWYEAINETIKSARRALNLETTNG